jgi:hypothetical protein
MYKDKIIATIVVLVCVTLVTTALINAKNIKLTPKSQEYQLGETVLTPEGLKGVILENYIGHYLIIRIDNGPGKVPRYNEARFLKAELTKSLEK